MYMRARWGWWDKVRQTNSLTQDSKSQLRLQTHCLWAKENLWTAIRGHFKTKQHESSIQPFLQFSWPGWNRWIPDPRVFGQFMQHSAASTWSYIREEPGQVTPGNWTSHRRYKDVPKSHSSSLRYWPNLLVLRRWEPHRLRHRQCTRNAKRYARTWTTQHLVDRISRSTSQFKSSTDTALIWRYIQAEQLQAQEGWELGTYIWWSQKRPKGTTFLEQTCPNHGSHEDRLEFQSRRTESWAHYSTDRQHVEEAESNPRSIPC